MISGVSPMEDLRQEPCLGSEPCDQCLPTGQVIKIKHPAALGLTGECNGRGCQTFLVIRGTDDVVAGSLL